MKDWSYDEVNWFFLKLFFIGFVSVYSVFDSVVIVRVVFFEWF